LHRASEWQVYSKIVAAAFVQTGMLCQSYVVQVEVVVAVVEIAADAVDGVLLLIAVVAEIFAVFVARILQKDLVRVVHHRSKFVNQMICH